jgi:effector-binding domain-containing protein
MPSYTVGLQHLDPVPLAAVRRQVKQSELSRVVPEGCGLVWSVLHAQQAKAGRNIAIYWDNMIRLDVGVELYAPFEERGEVVRSATPAGPAAVAIHYGPYGGLGAAHRAIRAWCEANHHKLAGPNWEIYGHWQEEWNADPSRIRTDVFYQLTR